MDVILLGGVDQKILHGRDDMCGRDNRCTGTEGQNPGQEGTAVENRDDHIRRPRRILAGDDGNVFPEAVDEDADEIIGNAYGYTFFRPTKHAEQPLGVF